jgi:ATP-dependent phosphofructokinase / diphosphate-dependent phosphofructokinase
MRLGVLTGGGDVPGLNSAIKVIVDRATEDGHEILGMRRGWAGLLNYDLSPGADNRDCVIPLTRQTVRAIDRFGGTYLHSSRTNPGKVSADARPSFLQPPLGANPPYDFTPHVLKVLEALDLDALLPIGGDDTLSYGLRLHREGFHVVAIPKTMDNDVHGTDYCIGFSTAITRSVDAVHALRTPIGSHERIGVIELFGRNSGETALVTAYLSNADRAVIPEVSADVNRLAELLMRDRDDNPSHYAIVLVSEGAILAGMDVIESGQADAYGHRKLGGVGQLLGDELKRITGMGIVYQQLGYMMRSGPPDSLDRMVATSYGSLALELALNGKSGMMVALHKGVYTDVPIEVIGEGLKRVDIEELYDTNEYRPKVRHLMGKPMFLY